MPTLRNKPAFTLVELLVALVVSSFLVTATIGVFTLFRKSMSLDQSRSDISQNGRIALDRLTRELRQTPGIVTHMPDTPLDLSVAQPGEIEFEDGHANDLTYHRYYVQNGTLKYDQKEYYFSYDTSSRVKWNSTGTGGVTPVTHVISTSDVADGIQSLTVYGVSAIQIELVSSGLGNQTFKLRTTVLGRNL